MNGFKSLVNSIKEKMSVRQRMWQDLYDNFQERQLKLDSTSQCSFDIPIGKTSCTDASQDFATELCSLEEMEIIYKIECVLGSNLKDMFYEREKAAMFSNFKRRSKIAQKLIREIYRLLRRHTKSAEIQEYVRIICKMNPLVKEKVEVHLKSNLQEVLLNVWMCNGTEKEFQTKIQDLDDEWCRLELFLSPSEVTTYAMYVIRKLHNLPEP